jgi:hypothetical protein
MNDLLASLPITLTEQIKEVEREIEMRRKVYARIKIPPSRAAYRIRCLEAVLATLRKGES